jgi:hypothetical protein
MAPMLAFSNVVVKHSPPFIREGNTERSYMIFWLASYPRSGNTFFRIVLHRVFNVPTYSVYDDDDPVAQRIGLQLVGYRAKPMDRAAMAASSEFFFVKTHKRRKTDSYPAIYLVRDGRDAVVSQARLCAADGQDRKPFDQVLREQILRPWNSAEPSSGSWGGNVLSWLSASDSQTVVVRYEDLVAAPQAVVVEAVRTLCPELAPSADAQVPNFAELKTIDSEFFRRGEVGSHRDEMSAELQELFWQVPENTHAMARLGYLRTT